MNEIYERSPTRVDLAGGTLDCWPLYLFLDNPVTVNVAIDIFTHCWLTERTDQKVILESDDLKAKKEYPNLAAALQDTQAEFELYRAHLRFWKPTKGLHLRTKSESPVGGGLGGSSSLCISMLKAFTKWMGAQIDQYEMVKVASHIEAQVLQKPTGTQDYFPPIFGGVCFIEYGVPGPRITKGEFNAEAFEGRFLLVYTGKQHHSGINNWQVIKNYLDGDPKPKAALQKLAVVSKDLQKAWIERRIEDLPKLFDREYDARTELSEGFSSPEIKKLKALASSVGASAKICGAGGGGCVLIWCPDKQTENMAQLCKENDFRVLETKPWQG